MAKSLRSKWRRKCRAVKRVRYGQKELERLKKTLGIDDTKKEEGAAAMTELSEVATIVDAKSISAKEKSSVDEKTIAKPDGEEVGMDLSGRVFNPKTMRDKNGTYPIWYHPRKIHRNPKAKSKVKSKRLKKKK